MPDNDIVKEIEKRLKDYEVACVAVNGLPVDGTDGRSRDRVLAQERLIFERFSIAKSAPGDLRTLLDLVRAKDDLADFVEVMDNSQLRDVDEFDDAWKSMMSACYAYRQLRRVVSPAACQKKER